MTQVFNPETGVVDAVTVIEAGPCPVVQVRTEAADGYDAVQLAFGAVAERKLSKGELGHLQKAGVAAHRHLVEFRGDSELEVGQTVTVESFQPGDKVFSFTGHTHRMGTRFTIEKIDAAGMPMQMLYDNPDWEHPPLTQFTPPLDFSDGSRLHYTCSYHNTTQQSLRLGESFFDEMCFYWAYYYPSRGFLFVPNF